MTTKAPKKAAKAKDIDDDDDSKPDLARRERAVLALLTTTTIIEAAELTGVHERTLRRWLSRPDFADLVASARRQSLAQASTRLVAGAGTAANVLLAIAEDKQAPHAARASAARTVLEMARGFVEIEDLDRRLRAIEDAAAAKAEETA